MNSDSIRRYADRPWAKIEESKQEHRARELAERGPGAALQTAHALWLHMRSVRPAWPTDDDRNEDLAHHLELVRILDRAGRGLAGR